MILDFFGQICEGFLYISACLCAYFEEEHIMLLGQFLRLVFLHLTIVVKIRFGANEYLADCLTSVAFNLLDPASDILEGLLVIDSICQDDAAGSFVVSLRNVPESFLTCSIPNLQSDFGTINGNGLDLEIYSNGSDVAIFEDSITEFSEQVSLANPTVSNDYNFSQEVFLCLFSCHGWLITFLLLL